MKGIKTRLLSALCVLALALTLTPAAWAAQVFPDVQPGDWYYETVMDMVELGAVDGLPEGNFAPIQSISAAEFCKTALEVLPGGADQAQVDALAGRLEDANPGYWANSVIAACELRGAGAFGETASRWSQPMTRAEMVYAMAALYRTSGDGLTLNADERVTWLMGDYQTAVKGHKWEAEILWAYSAGLAGGVNADGDFNLDGTVTRAEACTILSRLIHPDKRLSVDWTEAEAREAAANAPLTRLEDGSDFAGKSRVRYNLDVAYDYCRQLEREIGIQIFYLPEFTEKALGLVKYENFSSFPLDRSYFELVLGELQKMKAAYDLYPSGFLKEMISKKNQSRGTEIILCPYTYAGLTSYGIHLYDESGDAKKVDQIYYTGIGDSRYYSHEMGHMVMSCAAILGGWSKVCGDWDGMNAGASYNDYVSTYAMTNRPEDWAETWAALWHDTDVVTAQAGSAPVLLQKIRYMTNLLRSNYSTFQNAQLPWAGLL